MGPRGQQKRTLLLVVAGGCRGVSSHVCKNQSLFCFGNPLVSRFLCSITVLVLSYGSDTIIFMCIIV